MSKNAEQNVQKYLIGKYRTESSMNYLYIFDIAVYRVIIESISKNKNGTLLLRAYEVSL